MLYPAPAVLIGSGDSEGRKNLMTAAWTGTICSDPVMVSVSIRPERYSHGLITETGEFTINLTTRELAYATDYCGVKSGRDIDKFEAMHLTPLPSAHIRAPGVAESPVVLECKVTECRHLGVHDMFIAKVLGVNVDDQYLDRRGKLSLEKADLITYSHGEYYTLGDKLGTFGFSVRKSGGKPSGGKTTGEKTTVGKPSGAKTSGGKTSGSGGAPAHRSNRGAEAKRKRK